MNMTDVLKFNSIFDLSQWLNENDMSISDMEISIPVMTSGYAHVGDMNAEPATMTTTAGNGGYMTMDGSFVSSDGLNESAAVSKNIDVKSLTRQPIIKEIQLTESTGDDNIWYVDSFESIKDACSTGKVVYKGDTLLMNVCESDGKCKVTLVVEVDGNIAQMAFNLETNCNNQSEYDMILAI